MTIGYEVFLPQDVVVLFRNELQGFNRNSWFIISNRERGSLQPSFEKIYEYSRKIQKSLLGLDIPCNFMGSRAISKADYLCRLIVTTRPVSKFNYSFKRL